jgi:hypothetical protein
VGGGCKALALLFALVVVLLAAPGARAADIGPDDEIVLTGTVVVPTGEHADRIWIGDGEVYVAGRSAGSIVAIHAPVRISGLVEGDVIGLSQRITLTPGAVVDGDLIWAGERPVIPPGATVYGDVRHLRSRDVSLFGGFLALHVAIWLAVTLSSLALGLVLLWIAPRAADAAYAVAGEAVGPAIGWGAALFFGLPLAAIVALVTLIGIPLGIMLLLALLPLWALGYVTTGWLVGRAIVAPSHRRVPTFLAGWGILRAIAFVPFLGTVAGWAATVFGLGVLARAVWRVRGGEPTLEATIDR